VVAGSGTCRVTLGTDEESSGTDAFRYILDAEYPVLEPGQS
jgi:hypothetical protein